MSGVDRAELVRFLRQRVEAGMPALVLDGLDRGAVAELLKKADEPPRGASTRASAPTVRTPAVRAAAPTPTAPAAPAPVTADVAPAAPDAPVADLDYERLRATALVCTRCPLAAGRTQVVFSDGNPDARVMVVGEAPGANEDRTGLPFVGAAGKLLDLMLASVDLSRRDSVYICNVLKCRPPGNRNPLPEEIEACSPYLRRQIQLVRPEAILAVGTFAAQLLTGTQDALGKLRGSVYSYEGVPLVVTYHPAALLRNPGWRRPTWDDLQLLVGVLDTS